MKSPGIIYRQYRQMRKLALMRYIYASKRRLHENCFYSGLISYTDADGKNKCVKLCLLNKENLDVCTCPRDCNAFAPKWSEDMVVERFSSVMSNNSAKRRLFPELWAYEWVLDKSLTEAMKSPGLLSRALVWMISVLEAAIKLLDGKTRIIGYGDRNAKA